MTAFFQESPLTRTTLVIKKLNQLNQSPLPKRNQRKNPPLVTRMISLIEVERVVEVIEEVDSQDATTTILMLGHRAIHKNLLSTRLLTKMSILKLESPTLKTETETIARKMITKNQTTETGP